MKWNKESDVKQPSAERRGSAGLGSALAEYRGFGMGFGRESERAEEIENIDFKMVTFSLAGKDYGIDIMKVKEIAKFGRFTYVPNTRPFVTGVYNLRGEIISIIDLRLLFNLPVEPRDQDEPQDGLILRLENNLIGVVVDRIDRVVGISSESIQPPHPIFADINISYISGVVEHEERLYIILDAERIFTKDNRATDPQQRSDRGGERAAVGEGLAAQPGSDVEYRKQPTAERADSAAGQSPGGLESGDSDAGSTEVRDASATREAAAGDDSEFGFVVDGLATFGKLQYSAVNRDWLKQRYVQWATERRSAGKQAQLAGEQDADEFMLPFFSPCTARLWEQTYAEAVRAVLPDFDAAIVNAWNPGCGKGYESYSLAALLTEAYQGKRVKVFAGDNDLLRISTAPSLVLSPEEIPAYLQPYCAETRNGIGFSDRLKNSILFEYHDVLHESDVPETHVVLCRDLISLLPSDEQERLLTKIYEALVHGGILITGKNERLAHDGRWEVVGPEVSAYRKV